MKTLFLAASLAAGLALSACAPIAPITGGATHLGSLSAPDQVAVLKEVNRHLETCDRTYAWPFAVTVHCSPVAAAAPTAPLSAADIAALVEAAVNKAMAKIAAPSTN